MRELSRREWACRSHGDRCSADARVREHEKRRDRCRRRNETSPITRRKEGDSEAWGARRGKAARNERSHLCCLFTGRERGMSHGRAYMRPRVGVGKSAASGRSGRCQLRSAAPVVGASATGPFCGPTDFRHSHDLKSYLRTSSMEKLKETG
jgi:hypothetical protein